MATPDNAYAIHKKITAKGKVRFYRHDFKWRLRLMSRSVAELDLSTGAAVIADQAPVATDKPHTWALA